MIAMCMPEIDEDVRQSRRREPVLQLGRQIAAVGDQQRAHERRVSAKRAIDRATRRRLIRRSSSRRARAATTAACCTRMPRFVRDDLAANGDDACPPRASPRLDGDRDAGLASGEPARANAPGDDAVLHDDARDSRAVRRAHIAPSRLAASRAATTPAVARRRERDATTVRRARPSDRREATAMRANEERVGESGEETGERTRALRDERHDAHERSLVLTTVLSHHSFAHLMRTTRVYPMDAERCGSQGRRNSIDPRSRPSEPSRLCGDNRSPYAQPPSAAAGAPARSGR